MRSWRLRLRLRAAIRDLNPGYFALVMATGIVSKAMRLDGAARLSGLLLGAGIVAYVLLAVAYAWRLAGYRREFLADARDPGRAFAFFTFTAASDVLAARLAGDGHTVAPAVLMAAGVVGWLLLSYSLPLLLVGTHGPQPALAGANGTWFIWVVASQSVAVAATSLHPPVPGALVAIAVGCWAVGVVLYLLIAALVAVALLTYPVRPAELTPPYWVFMGATAISVLAGAQILELPPDPLSTSVRDVVAGLSVVLWAFGTWLIPLLLAAGAWRHLLHRVQLAYEPGLWSIVFPVGMYGVASHELGSALSVSWLVTLGRYEAWLALAVWAVVFLAMAGTLLRSARLPDPSAPASQ
ncbi:MAG: tellurite resistance/C4-dicarboxylate transporter family protein [Streptosporangiaceae bacterium]